MSVFAKLCAGSEECKKPPTPLEEAHRDLRRAKWKLRAAEAELAATPANETVKEVVEGRRRTVKMCEAIIGLIKAETGLGQPPEGLHKECQQLFDWPFRWQPAVIGGEDAKQANLPGPEQSSTASGLEGAEQSPTASGLENSKRDRPQSADREHQRTPKKARMTSAVQRSFSSGACRSTGKSGSIVSSMPSLS